MYGENLAKQAASWYNITEITGRWGESVHFGGFYYMRGIPSLITDIRKKVFTEVARMAYNGDDYTKAEDLPYIFDRYYRSRSDAGKQGTGLGLSIVKHALKLHNASINVRSVPDEGTTMTLTFKK